MHGRTHAHTDNVKTVYPPQTKFAGGIIIFMQAQCLYFININVFWKIIKLFQELSEYLHFSLTDDRRTDGWTDIL